MAGATIRLFLPNGDAQSLRVAEISNGNGKALAAPRSEIEGLLDREYESELKGFSCTIKGLTARGQRSAQGVVVFKGSEASAELRPSAKERAPWLISLRDRLIASGVRVRESDRLRFNQDYEFLSPSAAASIVHGGHANGLTSWRTLDGTTLRELEAAL